MRCPRCQGQIQKNRCLRCGLESNPSEHSESSNQPSNLLRQPISFNFHTHSQTKKRETTSDWRSQLDRKLSQLNEKKAEITSFASEKKRKTKGLAAKSSDRQINRPLFEYRLARLEKGHRNHKIVTLAKAEELPQSTSDKPLIRMPLKPYSVSRSYLPKQKELGLEPLSLETIGSATEQATKNIPEIESVSQEVLFSRLLAGLIDLFFPILVGSLFACSAAWILNFNFFSSVALNLGLLFSFLFFFLNSLFFFFLSGQTPGMYLTDLRLLGDDSEDIPIKSLCLRIGLFLPVVASLVGLLSCFFDPACRCWHDQLSRTRIVPASQIGRTDTRQ